MVGISYINHPKMIKILSIFQGINQKDMNNLVLIIHNKVRTKISRINNVAKEQFKDEYIRF